MKAVAQWIETVIDSVDTQRQQRSMYLIMLIVLVIAAGSLVMLLNSPA